MHIKLSRLPNVNILKPKIDKHPRLCERKINSFQKNVIKLFFKWYRK